jgi:predicted RND superfamily exporter protein
MMDRIARFIVSHNKRVIAATALLSLLAAAMLFRMSFNAGLSALPSRLLRRSEANCSLLWETW